MAGAMRIRAVVQRWGTDVAGGAESFCKSLTTRLAQRGHEVQVITSTATDYLTWKPVHHAGTSTEEGLEVVRLHPRFLRDPGRFAHLDQRVSFGERPLAPSAQHDWLLLEGPTLDGLERELRQPTDITTFYTYLYPTTATGVMLASPWGPTLVHPTAHSEPQLDLQVFDSMFDHTDMFVVSTPEEAELIKARSRNRAKVELLGIGVDPIDASAIGQLPDRVQGRPYVTVVGRVDPAKGSMEAVRYFVEYKRRHPGELALLIVGEQTTDPPEHPDVITTGFVDQATRDMAMSNAQVLIQPSWFESFSLVLAEAWTAGVPALVQRNCPATSGQTLRSGGGMLYHDYASFEASLRMLLESDQTRRTLGESGRRFVARNYAWEDVVDRYEAQLRETIEISRSRLSTETAPR